MGKFKDLTGQKFGKLTAIRISGLAERGRKIWECKCDCGKIKNVKGGDLSSGNTKSCGCSTKKDLTGKRFGKLIVLEFSHKNKDHRFWKCLCDCGKITYVGTSELNCGNTKTCGCSKTDIIDLTNQKFGRWTVTKRVNIGKHGSSHWLCKCDCGTERVVRSNSLRKGESLSCGCLQREKAGELGRSKATHGMSGTSIYGLWKSIRGRCYNTNGSQYKDYGGRGIKVCNRWQKFENFLEDMGSEIPKGMTLDRIDSNKDYAPENCRWATMKEQQNNRTNNVLIKYNSEELTISQWAEKLGFKYGTLYDRLITYGWSVEKSFTTPLINSPKKGLIF